MGPFVVKGMSWLDMSIQCTHSVFRNKTEITRVEYISMHQYHKKKRPDAMIDLNRTNGFREAMKSYVLPKADPTYLLLLEQIRLS